MMFPQINWNTCASVASAVAAIVNSLVVVVLAYYNHRYLKATDKIVKSSEQQSRDTSTMAVTAQRTLDLLLEERKESFLYQMSVFRQQMNAVRTELILFQNILNNDSRSPSVRPCYFLPGRWQECYEFIVKNAPAQETPLRALESKLVNLGEKVESQLRLNHTMWLSGKPQRDNVSAALKEAAQQVDGVTMHTVAAIEKRLDSKQGHP